MLDVVLQPLSQNVFKPLCTGNCSLNLSIDVNMMLQTGCQALGVFGVISVMLVKHTHIDAIRPCLSLNAAKYKF